MKANRLTGSWRLVSAVELDTRGQTTTPWSPSPRGHLVYAEDGHMAVTIVAEGRPRFASDDLHGGSQSDKAGAYATFVAYSGRYEVAGDRVVHHVEVAWLPNWEGSVQERFMELHGDRLTLSTPFRLAGGEARKGVLVWERVRPMSSVEPLERTA